ncbi:GtrA family protein [Microbacterium maritypicum]|uniref:GtrA family protein n=1 Tax=Microbacterium TaxID=33882 RepID=UPI001421C515|nr:MULTISPECIES: GtrA family protein [Microbacterium]NIG64983.1 GtrA family protein [Microbacterium sp. Be9]
MHERPFRSLARDLLRFTAVGGVGVVIDVVVFNLLRATLLSNGSIAGAVLIAKAVATVLAILANWAGNRWWTFRDRHGTHIAAEMASFVAVSLVGSAIAIGCLTISHYLLGFTSALADNISTNVIGLLLGSLFRFVASRRWVFRAPEGSLRAEGGTSHEMPSARSYRRRTRYGA